MYKWILTVNTHYLAKSRELGWFHLPRWDFQNKNCRIKFKQVSLLEGIYPGIYPKALDSAEVKYNYDVWQLEFTISFSLVKIK